MVELRDWEFIDDGSNEGMSMILERTSISLASYWGTGFREARRLPEFGRSIGIMSIGGSVPRLLACDNLVPGVDNE